MIKYNAIPIQASFDTLNPAIPALEPDHLVIPRSTQPWEAQWKVACINNYGASGSNATMIVCEPPAEVSNRSPRIQDVAWLLKYPIFVSANSRASLVANCSALQAHIDRIAGKVDSGDLLPSLSYNLAMKQNRSLPHILCTTAASLSELSHHLSSAASETTKQVYHIEPKAKPVVLVFGGQVNDVVGLGKDLYEKSALFRSHLDECDAVLRSFGLSGLYPEIFQAKPVSDIVALQSMVFSLQYSCSKSWMDSGLRVEAVVGHSLGQFAAMCISGALSLEEGLKLVSGRASLMQKHWGLERGSMLALDADWTSLAAILSEVNSSEEDRGVEVACYNGPMSHVLVGREVSIQKVQDIITARPFTARPIKSKRLNVTHGFHSVFTEPLLPSLKTLAGELNFKNPSIPLETCSNGKSWNIPSADLIMEHTRTPVYFGQAIERLARRLGPCTWLEAGSASSIIGMVRRALDPAAKSENNFQAAQLSNTGSIESLTETTVNLWKWGHRAQFWPFHHTQKHEYTPLNMPPYQFEKTSHWLEWKEASGETVIAKASTEPAKDERFIKFVGYLDKEERVSELSVNARTNEWIAHVSGHAVLDQPLCPASLYVELSARAATILKADTSSGSFIPHIENIKFDTPLGLAQNHLLTLLMTKSGVADRCWTFEMLSQPRDKRTSRVSHASGKISLESPGAALLTDFTRYEKLLRPDCFDRFKRLKAESESEVLQGKMVYKIFSKVVTYAEWYKGVKGVISYKGEALGHTMLPDQNEPGLAGMVTSPLALDSFIQVAGIHVNNLEECGPGQVFVCTKLDRIQVSPEFTPKGCGGQSWDVYTTFTRPRDRTVSNDIYVFESSTRKLVMIFLGVLFNRVPTKSLAKVLSQANGSSDASPAKQNLIVHDKVTPTKRPLPPALSHFARPTPQTKGSAQRPGKASSQGNINSDLRALIHQVTDIPVEELEDDASLEHLGVDSLMINEIASEIASFFEVEISPRDFELLPNIKSLHSLIRARKTQEPESDEASSLIQTEEESTGTTPGTPATIPEQIFWENETVERLAKLLATHLEAPENADRNANLAAQGLDSLMCMELGTDIKDIFDVELDLHRITDQTTFGDLCDMVNSNQKAEVPPSSEEIRSSADSGPQARRVPMETVTYKHVGDLPLQADIYYPPEITSSAKPVGTAP